MNSTFAPGNEGASEILAVRGETYTIPQARFGHTSTTVSKHKIVQFGGATGDTGKYSMTGETYIFNMLLNTWTELTPKGVAPSPRAAHSSTNVE
jgi:protein phosphatase